MAAKHNLSAFELGATLARMRSIAESAWLEPTENYADDDATFLDRLMRDIDQAIEFAEGLPVTTNNEQKVNELAKSLKRFKVDFRNSWIDPAPLKAGAPPLDLPAEPSSDPADWPTFPPDPQGQLFEDMISSPQSEPVNELASVNQGKYRNHNLYGKWDYMSRAERARSYREAVFEAEAQWDIEQELLKSCPTSRDVWTTIEKPFLALTSDTKIVWQQVARFIYELDSINWPCRDNPKYVRPSAAEAYSETRNDLSSEIIGETCPRESRTVRDHRHRKKIKGVLETYDELLRLMPNLKLHAQSLESEHDLDVKIEALRSQVQAVLGDWTQIKTHFGLTLDYSRQIAKRNDKEIVLTPLPWHLLLIFLRSIETPCDRSQLSKAWTEAGLDPLINAKGEGTKFDVAMNELRRHLHHLGVTIERLPLTGGSAWQLRG